MGDYLGRVYTLCGLRPKPSIVKDSPTCLICSKLNKDRKDNENWHSLHLARLKDEAKSRINMLRFYNAKPGLKELSGYITLAIKAVKDKENETKAKN